MERMLRLFPYITDLLKPVAKTMERCVHTCSQTSSSDSFSVLFCLLLIESNLVISNSKGLSEILRDIRNSTYQICRIEEKLNRTTYFTNK